MRWVQGIDILGISVFEFKLESHDADKNVHFEMKI